MTDEEIQSAIDESEKRSDGGLSGLREECRRLEAESSGLRDQLRTALLRMEALEQRLEETASVAAEAAEEAANASAAAADGGGGDEERAEPVMDGPAEQPPVSVDREPFAYEVMEAEGKVYCFLPKKKEEISGSGEDEEEDDDEGASEFCGGAYGGPHLGSSNDPIADADAPPHAKSGYKSNSGASGESSISKEPEQLDFSWAHYGWYEVGEMNTSGSGVEDKVVVATFDVPIDPPEDQREGASVEGPSLSDVELVDVDDWRETCKDSWSQFDDPSGESVTRKVPIALLANGVITQLCLGVPFVERVSSPKEEVQIQCPPTVSGFFSGSGIVITVQNYEKSGEDCVPSTVTSGYIPLDEFHLDCDDVKDCISGATETVVTDVFVSGDGNLYKTVRTAKALEWGAPSNVMIVSGTTCEEGGTS